MENNPKPIGPMDYFHYVLPLLNDLLTSEVGVSLTDRQSYLLYKPGKDLDLNIQPGTPVKPGSAVARAMAERRRVVIKADKSLFGLAYIAVAIPVFDADGQVIGAASIQESVERQEALKAMAQDLTDSIGILASTTQEISAQSEEISSVASTLAAHAQESREKIQETDKVIGIIKSISKQSNLLGLNAAIEAARAGDTGRGFGVVAEEIRKLALHSAESIQKVEEVIKTVQDDNYNTHDRLKYVDDILTQLSSAVTEVAGAIQQAGSLAGRLDQMADFLARDTK